MQENETPARPPLVLIANDQEWSARSLESILGPEGYAVLRAYTGAQAIDRAQTAQPDLIILDMQMPDISGLEVCRTLKNDPRIDGTTPILVTTAGPSGRTQRLDAYRAGAWEFLGQPLDGEALLLKLANFLASKQAVDLERDRNLLDEDTGLYNMRGLARRAREIGADVYRQRAPLACVVFVPHLDEAEAGTAAVPTVSNGLGKAVGRVFRAAGRASDAIGRMGQSEIGLIAPATDHEGTLRLVERLRHAVSDSRLTLTGGSETQVELRAGYCVVPDLADSTLDATEVLLRATTALRELVKRGGPDPVQSYEQLQLN